MECEEERKIFVGGINNETTEESLSQHFSRYGDVLSTAIIKDRVTGKPRGFGFVVFSDVSSARDALNDRNHILHGKEVSVKKTRKKAQQQQTQCYYCQCYMDADHLSSSNHLSNRKIFVGGLPQGLTLEEFQDFFSRFGDVVNAVIISDGVTGLQRGFGFITFRSEESVTNVMQQTHYDLHHRCVEVKRAVPKHWTGACNCICHRSTGSHNSYWSALHVDYGHYYWQYAIYGQRPMFSTHGQAPNVDPLWASYYAQPGCPYVWPRADYYWYGAAGVPPNCYDGASPARDSRMFYANYANGSQRDVSQDQESGHTTASNLRDESSIGPVSTKSQCDDITGPDDTSIGSVTPQSQHADTADLDDTAESESGTTGSVCQMGNHADIKGIDAMGTKGESVSQDDGDITSTTGHSMELTSIEMKNMKLNED